MDQRIGIVSYCDHLRTLAHANHALYADRHDYVYVFDIAPTTTWKFKAKIEKIRKFLPLFDWVFWIDDDAFVMQPDKRLEPFVDAHPDAGVIFCMSPVDDGKWTWISSGNFFIRNTPLGAQLLDAVLATDMDEVAAWWDSERFGHYTKGDQDALVFQLHTNPAFADPGFVVRLPYEAFNSRPTHFESRHNEHFLVHFTGGDKRGQARAFGEKWNLTEALVYSSQLKTLKGVYRPNDD